MDDNGGNEDSEGGGGASGRNTTYSCVTFCFYSDTKKAGIAV